MMSYRAPTHKINVWNFAGSDPKTLRLIYKAMIMLHIDYGSQVLDPFFKYTINILDKLRFQRLRKKLGCTKLIPIPSLLYETGENATKSYKEGG